MDKLQLSLTKRFDLILLAAVTVLIIIGISTIQSTIIASKLENSILTSQLINVQLLSVMAGVLIALFLVMFNYRYLKFVAIPLYLFTLVLLGGVLLLGETTRGSVRWYDLGFFNLQPSQISTILLMICFAAFFSSVKEKINEWRYLAISIVMVLIPTGLILAEPDLGSSIVLVIIWATQLLMTPLKFSKILPIVVVVFILLPFGWNYLEDYQKLRLTAFMNPESDPLGAGYNINQSIIAVGAGGVSGRGWGRGTQSHLQFLPEQHTDFIFATYAEEQGFLGSIIVVALYLVILWRLFVLIQRVEGLFGQLILVGISIWLTTHVMVNIGMNIGMAPITGIPLPFLSYGGTAMVTALFAIGLATSVIYHQYPAKHKTVSDIEKISFT